MQYYAFVLGNSVDGYKLGKTFETMKEARKHKKWLRQAGLDTKEFRCILFVGDEEYIWPSLDAVKSLIGKGKSPKDARLAKIAAQHGITILKL